MPAAPASGSSRTRRVIAAIDRGNAVLGRATTWLTLAMVLVGAFNAIVRYLGRWTGWSLSSNAWLELQWYLFSLVFLLAASWTLQRDAHVRVDVFYSRLSERGRIWIDLLGSVLFLIPFSIFALVFTWPSVLASWRVLEVSPDPGGLPRYPIKAVILVAFALLLLQGVAEVLRHVERLRGHGDGEGAPPSGGARPIRGEGI